MVGASILHSNRMKKSQSRRSFRTGAMRHEAGLERIVRHADAFCPSPDGGAVDAHRVATSDTPSASTASAFVVDSSGGITVAPRVQRPRAQGPIPTAGAVMKRVAFRRLHGFLVSFIHRQWPGCPGIHVFFAVSRKEIDVDAAQGPWPGMTKVGVNGCPAHGRRLPGICRAYLVANPGTRRWMLADLPRHKAPCHGVWFFSDRNPAHRLQVAKRGSTPRRRSGCSQQHLC